MSDLAQQIRDRLDTLCQYKAAGPRASAAISAVLDRHQHTLYNRWHRPTDTIADAVAGRCVECGQIFRVLWFPTVRDIATALGIEVPS